MRGVKRAGQQGGQECVRYVGGVERGMERGRKRERERERGSKSVTEKERERERKKEILANPIKHVLPQPQEPRLSQKATFTVRYTATRHTN